MSCRAREALLLCKDSDQRPHCWAQRGGTSCENVMQNMQYLTGLWVAPLKSMRMKHMLCSTEMGLLMCLKLNMWLSALLNQGQRDGKWVLPVLILSHLLFHTAACWRLLTFFVNKYCSCSTLLITKRNWAISKVLASVKSYLDKTSINANLSFGHKNGIV